jgi:hypothetical protein
MSMPFARRRPRWHALALAVVVAWLVQSFLAHRQPAPRDIPYGELVALLYDGKLAAVDLETDVVIATLKAPEGQGERVRAFRVRRGDDKAFIDELRASGVRLTGRTQALEK